MSEVPDNHRWVVVIGTVAQAERAFGTKLGGAPTPDAFVNGRPCSAYYGQKIATTLPGAYGSKLPYATCGYVPGQFTQVTPKPYRYGNWDKINGDLCGENGGYGEETLDIEAVHDMAPGAKHRLLGRAQLRRPRPARVDQRHC